MDGGIKRNAIRTLQPNKVISSSKLLGLLHFWGSALFYIHEIPIPVSYWNCQTLSAIILLDHNVRIRLLKTPQRAEPAKNKSITNLEILNYTNQRIYRAH